MTSRLYNKDCLDVLKEMEPESIDLVVTDCPYHIVSGGCTKDAVKIGRTYECRGMLSRRVVNDNYEYTKQGKLFKHNDIKFSQWLPEVYRVLKPDTHCYVMINPRNLKELWEEAEKAGFRFQNLIVWDKGNAVPNKYYMNAYELILMLRKGRAKNINMLGTTNILRVPNILRTKLHPTEKPVPLMEILINNSTNENDLVIDPFMGAGGAGVAALKNNRNFIGCELDEKYYSIAEQRINNINEPENKQLSFWDVWEGSIV